jgi:hypothetical protein
MKAQEPAQGICKTQDWGDAKVYHIECDCTCEDHSVSTWIEVEAEEDFGTVVTFYVKTWTPYSLSQAGLWTRIRKAVSILFKGVDTQEHDIILKEQAARNWIAAVEKSIKDVKEHKE